MHITAKITVNDMDQGNVEVELYEPYLSTVTEEDLLKLAEQTARKAWAATERGGTRAE